MRLNFQATIFCSINRSRLFWKKKIKKATQAKVLLTHELLICEETVPRSACSTTLQSLNTDYSPLIWMGNSCSLNQHWSNAISLPSSHLYFFLLFVVRSCFARELRTTAAPAEEVLTQTAYCCIAALVNTVLAPAPLLLGSFHIKWKQSFVTLRDATFNGRKAVCRI